MKNLAIVGIGYWGKKLVSEFSRLLTLNFAIHKGIHQTSIGFIEIIQK